MNRSRKKLKRIAFHVTAVSFIVLASEAIFAAPPVDPTYPNTANASATEPAASFSTRPTDAADAQSERPKRGIRGWLSRRKPEANRSGSGQIAVPSNPVQNGRPAQPDIAAARSIPRSNPRNTTPGVAQPTQDYSSGKVESSRSNGEPAPNRSTYEALGIDPRPIQAFSSRSIPANDSPRPRSIVATVNEANPRRGSNPASNGQRQSQSNMRAFDPLVFQMKANGAQLGDSGFGSNAAAQPPNVDTSPLASPSNFAAGSNEVLSGRPISLQAALYGAVTGNPDLIALRQGNVASAEAVEAAKQFPTTLNPTLWIDFRPVNLVPPDTFGGGRAGRNVPKGYQVGKQYIYVSWRQPIELKHQTTHRAAIAQAAYDQQQWTVVLAEMTSLVQTYRFYQTAAYRREKRRIARDLADFNQKLLESLHRRLEAGQTLPADVALAEVESQATIQQYEAAKQDYATALTDLHNQIGVPETAGRIEPLDRIVLPNLIPEIDENALIQIALGSRPEIFAARAQTEGAHAAMRLANADRTPTPIVGPEYESDEVAVQYFGFVWIQPIPLLNNGTPLLRQREAEYRRALVALQQIEQRTVAQVKASLAKWRQSQTLVERTNGLTDSLKKQVGSIERLFDAGQTDLNKLYQARQRLIRRENARLDAIWQATQAQADLLLALGAPTLIASLRGRMENGAEESTATTPPATPVGVSANGKPGAIRDSNPAATGGSPFNNPQAPAETPR
jgi:cobalt-zinc-cadmium efflux system outer membrane protein